MTVDDIDRELEALIQREQDRTAGRRFIRGCLFALPVVLVFYGVLVLLAWLATR